MELFDLTKHLQKNNTQTHCAEKPVRTSNRTSVTRPEVNIWSISIIIIIVGT